MNSPGGFLQTLYISSTLWRIYFAYLPAQRNNHTLRSRVGVFVYQRWESISVLQVEDNSNNTDGSLYMCEFVEQEPLH